MALYFYFNSTTGDLVYSDKATYSGSGYTSLGQQTNTAPTGSSSWVFRSQRANIKTVTKDQAITAPIDVLTTMSSMFDSCQSLISLDLSGFNTSNVTRMGYMFNKCSALTSLDLSGFDTSNVTEIYYMFCNCSALTSLDLSGFDTSNVTEINYMFYNCSALTSLDLSGFDTSNVTRIDYMFYSCRSLISLDLSGFDTSKVTNMSSMFSGASSLRIIDISPNMSNVLSQLPATTYYDVADGQSYAKASIPGGSTYVRNLSDLDLVATMVQLRQGLRAARHQANKTRQMAVKLMSAIQA